MIRFIAAAFATLTFSASLAHGANLERSVALGASHTCRIRQEKIECWGDTTYQQTSAPQNLDAAEVYDLRDALCIVTRARTARCVHKDTNFGTFHDLPLPKEVVGKQIAAASSAIGQMCVVTGARAHCWSYDFYGAREAKLVEITLPDWKMVTHVATTTPYNGTGNVCVIDENALKCLKPLTGPAWPPVAVTELAIIDRMACAIAAQGVQCHGELGYGTKPKTLDWTKIRAPRNLVGSYNHFCVDSSDGVQCWGEDRDGQSSPPAGLGKVERLIASETATCALAGKKLVCWGGTNQFEVPHDLHTIESLSLVERPCATSRGDVLCWGKETNRYEFVARNFVHPRELVAGENFTCALGENGVACWGYSRHYEDSVTRVPALNNPTHLWAGGDTACARTDNGSVCWGGAMGFPSPLRRMPSLDFGARLGAYRDASGRYSFWRGARNSDFATVPSRFLHSPRSFSVAKGWFDSPWSSESSDYFCSVAQDGELGCFWPASTTPRSLYCAHVAAIPYQPGAYPNERLSNARVVRSGEAGLCAIGDTQFARNTIECCGSLSELSNVQVFSKVQNPQGLWVGKRHACALDGHNKLYCWGSWDTKAAATSPDGVPVAQ